LKVTKMKPQCDYKVNPSSGSAKNSQKHCESVLLVSKTPQQCEYKENRCNGSGDLLTCVVGTVNSFLS